MSGRLHLVVVGHVDHGKSTLIGRLLHETGSLPPGRLEELQAASKARGVPVEWSYALDAFQAERDQAITIDTTQLRFKTALRDVVIIDAPGHREFLKNMISGAAQADAALLVVDAAEGLKDQTRRHAYLLHLLGLRHVAVVINKMDLVGFDAARFKALSDEVMAYLGEIGVAVEAVIPIAARDGLNLKTPAAAMPWYQGPTVLAQLDRFPLRKAAGDAPLRLPVQDVYRFDERRIVVGRVEAGKVSVGDTLLFSPSGRTAKVKSIEAWGTSVLPLRARAGDVVGFTLDEPIFVERGDMASHAMRAPFLTDICRVSLFWLSDQPLMVGATYTAKIATREVKATVQAIERTIDTETLASRAVTAVHRNDVAEVVLRFSAPVAIDNYTENAACGRCVLIDGFQTVGGGVFSVEGYPDQRQAAAKSEHLYAVDHMLSRPQREARNGHRGAVLWFTGLSGAGKSTLAMRLEQLLFSRGFQTYVLDGDNVRRGLNSDLGFKPDDRAENIRRVGEVAALFADAGFIVVTSFISPYLADRARARQAAGERFHEVYIKADVSVCEARDPKGLYKKARLGEIQDFTGISAPYEAPLQPELTVDTSAQSVEACLTELLSYVDRTLVLGSLSQKARG